MQAPTGTGKTCAFGIPIVEAVETNNNTIQALILCPTRELVLQTTSVLREISKFVEGVKIASVYGGERIDKQLMMLRRKPMIVVATPGRAIDFLQRNVLKLKHVKTVVLDEADRMLDMGFRNDINTILLATPSERQTVLFSATINAEVARIATDYQTDAVSIKIAQETATVDSVEQFFIRVENKTKLTTLVQLLNEKRLPSCIVFTARKRMTETVAAYLAQNGYRAAALHGDLKQRQRDSVMKQYRDCALNVLVATDVAARGIDVNNVDAVINYDIPMDSDDYVHRIGRTGRAKQTGAAYTFVHSSELQKLRVIMRETKADIQQVAISASAQGESAQLPRIALLPEAPVTKPAKKPVKKPVAPQADAKNDDTAADDAQMKRTRMFISLGSLDNISKKNIADLISVQCEVPSKQIGTIAVFESYSFFDIPALYVAQTQRGLKGKSHNERPIMVELSKGKAKRGK